MAKKLSKGPPYKPRNPEVYDNYPDLIKTMEELDNEREQTEEFKINNLEYDLRTTEWILEKARSRHSYAQNIYAALCNNDFQKLDVMQILTDQTWGCSWRVAGGIVADMLEKGDYLDWYCSGMANGSGFDYAENCWEFEKQGFVPEGVITDEIREDFRQLGWVPIEPTGNFK